MESTEWSALVEITVDSDESIEHWGEDLLDLLEDYAPVVSGRPGRVAARLSIDQNTAMDAGHQAADLVWQAAMKCGLDPIIVQHLEVTTPEYLDAQLAEPTLPVLLGVAELAETLGVSKQRASELAKSETFPRPITELASGPVWAESTVQRFIEDWVRRPGRPRVSAGRLRRSDSVSVASDGV